VSSAFPVALHRCSCADDTQEFLIDVEDQRKEQT